MLFSSLLSLFLRVLQNIKAINADRYEISPNSLSLSPHDTETIEVRLKFTKTPKKAEMQDFLYIRSEYFDTKLNINISLAKDVLIASSAAIASGTNQSLTSERPPLRASGNLGSTNSSRERSPRNFEGTLGSFGRGGGGGGGGGGGAGDVEGLLNRNEELQKENYLLAEKLEEFQSLVNSLNDRIAQDSQRLGQLGDYEERIEQLHERLEEAKQEISREQERNRQLSEQVKSLNACLRSSTELKI
jgi:uncharacterized Rmd1/YagE family protein